jgi:hypothetical protein
MATTKKALVTLAIVGFFTLFAFSLTVQAQQPIDMISCANNEVTTIVSSEELTIMVVEGKGINMDNLPSKIYDSMTFHGGGVLKIEKGKISGTLYYKYMDPSGDFLVVEVSQVGMERNWKYIPGGTGKWKGITGEGNATYITKAKPITPGTSQGCMRITGTYELKK